jgi:protein-L-isoaspartate O-methyltransferase
MIAEQGLSGKREPLIVGIRSGWARHLAIDMVESQLWPTGITDARVIDAVAKLPRELFVPEQRRTLARLQAEPWSTFWLNVRADNGVVELWGSATSSAQRKAARLAAELTPGRGPRGR